MSYVKIIGEDERYYVTLEPFTTQHGYQGVRFVGDIIPDTDKGFQVYDDQNRPTYDLSHMKYLYRSPNEYSVEPDEIEQPIGNNDSISSASVYDGLSRRINALSSQITELEPYTESKPAYIDDTEVIFDLSRNGSITAWLTVEDVRMPCNYEINENKIRVYFEPLEAIGTVTIQIQ